MMIFPTIELLDGKCVSLDRGNLDEPQIWHVDPVKMARGFAAAGASWMHLTDFDRLRGKGDNAALVEKIIRSAGIPVQLGGGFRSREAVEHWIDKGAGRIVLSTLAAREPRLVRELALRHPDQIVLSVDVWKNQVMTDGWKVISAYSPGEFLAAFDDAPLAGIILTDIDSDMHVQDVEAHLGVIAGLAAMVRSPVIASGVVRTVDDIARLKYIRSISGAIVGRALFNRTIDLTEALAVAQLGREPVAEFQ